MSDRKLTAEVGGCTPEDAVRLLHRAAKSVVNSLSQIDTALDLLGEFAEVEHEAAMHLAAKAVVLSAFASTLEGEANSYLSRLARVSSAQQHSASPSLIRRRRASRDAVASVAS